MVAVPHEVLGEDVGAAVVCQPSADPSAELDADFDAEAMADELAAFCRERLSDYKVPRRIWFVDALPATPPER